MGLHSSGGVRGEILDSEGGYNDGANGGYLSGDMDKNSCAKYSNNDEG